MNFDPNTLLASMFVSSIGFVLFTYGRKQRRLPHSTVGIVMLVYPYVVSSVPLMLGICAALVGLLIAATRLGL